LKLEKDNSSTDGSLKYSSSGSQSNNDNNHRTSFNVDPERASMAQKRLNIWQKASETKTKDRQKYHQVKLKPMETTNLPIGDDINEDTDFVETTLFHNINEIKEELNWYQIMTMMKELRADIFGLVEINRTLQHGIKQKWEQVTRKFFNHSRNIHSESDIPADNYKPGGTLTTITGKCLLKYLTKAQTNQD
jgi:hypothetical protein